MQVNVLVISQPGSFGQSIIEEFSDYPLYSVSYETDFSKLESLIETVSYKIFVIHVEEMEPEHFERVKSLLEKVTYASFLLVSRQSEFVMNLISKYEKAHAIYLPTQAKQIRLFSSKLALARILPSQKYKRYETNQMAEVEIIEKGDVLHGAILNLSLGGAFCVLDDEQPISIGSLIRVNVQNQPTDRKVLNAKVVWTKSQNEDVNGRFSFGLKFLGQNEIMTL